MNGLDPAGLATVALICLLILVFGFTDDTLTRRRRTNRRAAYVNRVVSAAEAAGILLDHAVCECSDCDTVICACPTGPCEGTVERACTHHRVLCADDRFECIDCRLDARSDAGVL